VFCSSSLLAFNSSLLAAIVTRNVTVLLQRITTLLVLVDAHSGSERIDIPLVMLKSVQWAQELWPQRSIIIAIT